MEAYPPRIVHEGGAGSICAVEIGGERNDQDRLKESCQGVALPNHDWPAACLLARPIGSEVRPQDLSALRNLKRARF